MDFARILNSGDGRELLLKALPLIDDKNPRLRENIFWSLLEENDRIPQSKLDLYAGHQGRLKEQEAQDKTKKKHNFVPLMLRPKEEREEEREEAKRAKTVAWEKAKVGKWALEVANMLCQLGTDVEQVGKSFDPHD
jgi:hypothetical protein